ncbi:hypothetical protein [Streptomyces sp. NPDC059874]|uniref:hypothetical protein n=1 Tax=Streptomyces sp. NPDC059874 TaxID=3346983 RepID=UPI00365B2DB8
MAESDRITIEQTAHGQFQTTAHHFDGLMARYLPASVADLRAVIAEMSPEIDWSDVSTVTECLMILAELHGYATN